MPVEVTNTIEGLNPAWPLPSDGVKEGDDHIRQQKGVLKNIFPGQSGNGLATPIISTEAELNILSGMTSSTIELNVLSGMTSSTLELNILTGVTKTTADINAFLIPGEIVNLIYPVGAIYCSASATSPDILFGVGVWTALADKQTLVQQGTYAAGSSGGSSSAVVVSHTHPDNLSVTSGGAHTHTLSANSGGGSNLAATNSGSSPRTTSSSGAHAHGLSGGVQSTGVSATNANMPPYLSVHMWQRVA